MKPATSNPEHNYVVCGMWGTTNLTLALVDLKSGVPISFQSGRGISKLSKSDIERELLSVLDHWALPDVRHVVLAGMVGSSLGWWEAPYIACPTSLDHVFQKVSTRSIRGMEISIIPGLSTKNFLDEPDIMRGEETELLAWMCVKPTEGAERSLVCIPGTHTKWVEVCGSEVVRFQTSVVGEVFDLLTRNGVLAKRNGDDGEIASEESFMEGVMAGLSQPENLLHLLMSVRARTILGEQDPHHASDRLSGLLIGADVATALNLANFTVDNALPVIGESRLARRYALALSAKGANPLTMNAQSIGLMGLVDVARKLTSG